MVSPKLAVAALAAAAVAYQKMGASKSKSSKSPKKTDKPTKEFSRKQCWAEVKKMLDIARNGNGKKLIGSIGGCAVIFVLVDIMKAQMQGYSHFSPQPSFPPFVYQPDIRPVIICTAFY